jgi:mono/diheme cytochrome c family protein
MTARRLALLALLVFSGMLVGRPARGQCNKVNSASSSATAAGSSGNSAKTTVAAAAAQSEEAMRAEGEKRFSANCGRCHQSPHKFPPRMMATIVRHMRVRATITDEDMRLILLYMTQ